MNLERSLDRRTFLKQAAATTGVLFAGLPEAGRAQSEGEVAQAPSELPAFISPDEVVSGVSADSVTTYQENFETHEFTSHNFNYRAEMPTDWIHQPGLSIPEAPVDIFLGQISKDYQTTVWIYKNPVTDKTTPEEYLDEILTKITFLQSQQLEDTGNKVTIGAPSGAVFTAIDDPKDFLVTYPAGEKNGWVVSTFMPKETESYYYLSNTGFIKDGYAWQFNMASDGEDPYANGDEIQKFMDMLTSIKLT